MSPCRHYVRWESPTRYYEMRLMRNLWGGLEVLQAWGGRNNRLGRIVYRPISDLDAWTKEIGKTGRLRSRHGYAMTRAE